MEIRLCSNEEENVSDLSGNAWRRTSTFVDRELIN